MTPNTPPFTTAKDNEQPIKHQTKMAAHPQHTSPDLVVKYNEFFEDYDSKEPKDHNMQIIIDKLNHIIEIAEEGIHELEKHN